MFKYVHHVHYVVRNRDTMVEYFLKNFGMTPSEQGITKPSPRFPYQSEVAYAYYDVGHTQIQMTEPLDPTSNMGKRLATQGAGIWHIAWAVDNIEQVARELTAKGNQLRGEGSTTEETPRGYHVINIDHHCSHGLRLQLVGK